MLLLKEPSSRPRCLSIPFCERPRDVDGAEPIGQACWPRASNRFHQEGNPDGFVLDLCWWALERSRSSVESYDRFTGSLVHFDSLAVTITLDVKPLDA
jgi:hypothetical protein